jgi:Putative addiction module component
MSEQVKILAEAAAKLDLDEQIDLAERIMAGLPLAPGIEAAWADEAIDRLDAYQRGEMQAEDAGVVLARIRAKIAARHM